MHTNLVAGEDKYSLHDFQLYQLYELLPLSRDCLLKILRHCVGIRYFCTTAMKCYIRNFPLRVFQRLVSIFFTFFMAPANDKELCEHSPYCEKFRVLAVMGTFCCKCANKVFSHCGFCFGSPTKKELTDIKRVTIQSNIWSGSARKQFETSAQALYHEVIWPTLHFVSGLLELVF